MQGRLLAKRQTSLSALESSSHLKHLWRRTGSSINLSSALVEHHPDPVDMLAQRRVVDLGVER